MKANSTNLSQTTVLPITEPMINAKEFDALRVIFRVEKPSRKVEQLSQCTPFFNGPSPAPKVQTGDAIKWLMAVLDSTDNGKQFVTFRGYIQNSEYRQSSDYKE